MDINGIKSQKYLVDNKIVTIDSGLWSKSWRYSKKACQHFGFGAWTQLVSFGGSHPQMIIIANMAAQVGGAREDHLFVLKIYDI